MSSIYSNLFAYALTTLIFSFVDLLEEKKFGNTDGLYFFKVDFRKFRNPCCTSLLLASVYFASTMNGIDLGGSKGGHLRSDT